MPGKIATASSVDALSIDLYRKGYDELIREHQMTVITNLTTMLIKQNFIDFKSELDDMRLSRYWVDDTVFGKGFKLWGQDLLKVDPFADKKIEDWYPIDPRKPKDYEVVITQRVISKIRFDFNETEMVQYFVSAEGVAKYLNNISTAVNQTKAVYIQQFIYNVFREGDNVWTDVVSPEFITEITPIIATLKNSFTNKRASIYEGEKNDRVTMLTAMVRDINLKIALATEKANQGTNANNAGATGIKIHIKPKVSDLDLLINQQDIIDINVYVKAGLFNAQFLSMPNVNIIQMSHIPVGTYRLFDRRWLQLSKNLDIVYSQGINVQTLWHTRALQHRFYVGTVPYAFGIWVTMQYQNASLPDLKTIIKTTDLGAIAMAGEIPTTVELEAGINTKNSTYRRGDATFELPSPTETHATAIGATAKYKGSVELTYTKA